MSFYFLELHQVLTHLQWIVKVVQSCLTLCDPMDYTVLGILQARILEWVAFPTPGNLSNPGIEPRSPALQVVSLPAEPQGKPKNTGVGSLSLLQQGVKPGSPALHVLSLPTELSVKPLQWILEENASSGRKGKDPLKCARDFCFSQQGLLQGEAIFPEPDLPGGREVPTPGQSSYAVPPMGGEWELRSSSQGHGPGPPAHQKTETW